MMRGRVVWLIFLAAVLIWPCATWAQRMGTGGQDGEWNVRHIGSAMHVTVGASPHMTVFRVLACGTTVSTPVQPQPGMRRRDLRLQNIGTLNIYIGGPHAALTATTGYTLHASSVSAATSKLDLPNYQGQIDCITATGEGNQNLSVIEVWR